jgi:queuosine precursor transporter
MKGSKFLPLIIVFYITILLTSNIVSTKITHFWGFTFDAGTILFPLSYIFWDILTEVYGYKQTKNIIWMGFFSLFLMSSIIILVWVLPPASDWTFQQDYQNILGLTPRIVWASLIAYLIWEFSNSYILAKIKVKMKWKYLFVRTIGSTLVAEIFDTFIFVFLAFYWLYSSSVLWAIILSNYIFKVGVEVLFTPLTYIIVSKLKKSEKTDVYDVKTDFNPFVL